MNKLIVFAKAPVPGQVKTRLCPPLRHKQAATLYRAFVKDTLGLASRSEAVVEVAYDPSGSFPDLSWCGGPTTPFFLQKGKGLGERLAHAFARAFASGGRKVVIIGSDSPDLAPARLQRAFSSLRKKDLVLGPAEDGGYYLVGLSRAYPELFAGIPWSTAQVYAATLKQARELGLSLTELPKAADVDTYEDFKRLLAKSSSSRLPATAKAWGAIKKGVKSCDLN